MAKVSFRTNVLLKSIIGKDLITNDNIAVLELVKNSFDAGSRNVDLIFKNIDHNEELITYKKYNKSKIIITDVGIGMSEYDLVNKWLNIAYSEKKTKKEEFNRTLAGNKGVGRFSCDRLGKFLTIYTKQSNSSFLKLFIDWREFERIDDIELNIQDIEFELENISKELFEMETGIQPYKQGTTLVIESLREEWNYKKIASLRRQLEKLINPDQSFKAEKFNIKITAEEFYEIDKIKSDNEKVNGLIENKIFQKLDFRASSIQSKISRDGKYIITILKDRGSRIFSLIERNPFQLLKNIKIYIYYLNPYSKAYFKKQTGIRSVDFGSISLFINGFRIPPYGDSGDDWLAMENRKGQGRTRYLGTREVIGRIEIIDNKDTHNEEDNEFKIISSRSGVRNNDIFFQLVKETSPYGYYYKTFRRIERFVVEGIKWDSIIPKDFARLEKKILNDKNWDISKEEYKVDSLSRNKQILSVIHKIIHTKDDDILELKINKLFVSDLIDEQKSKTLVEIDSIVQELNTKDLSNEQLKKLFEQVVTSTSELESFTIDKGELDHLRSQQKKLQDLIIKQEEKRKQAEEEAEKLALELELEKEKNTYLLTSKRSMSEDAKGLIHNVKQTSKRSKQNAQKLYNAFKQDNVKKNQSLKWLSTIIYNSDKALKISNLITRANFKANSDYQDVNIIKFIQQYLDLYNIMFDDNELTFSIETKVDSFWKRISILDLSLVIDDLVSNSYKAGSKSVKIIVSKNKDSDLVIIFSDDGDGLPTKFEKNSNIIFDLGVTTTDGSGIGLNYVRKTLSKMQGKISFIGNNKFLKGASFEVIISKSYK